ncbi:hypothetical protein BASA83_000754 [Batrachochytrium salamandrivorans]|nr:hypothetical protein BASA83_000754 [Batrachochytrium salamandrivorans]
MENHGHNHRPLSAQSKLDVITTTKISTLPTTMVEAASTNRRGSESSTSRILHPAFRFPCSPSDPPVSSHNHDYNHDCNHDYSHEHVPTPLPTPIDTLQVTTKIHTSNSANSHRSISMAHQKSYSTSNNSPVAYTPSDPHSAKSSLASSQLYDGLNNHLNSTNPNPAHIITNFTITDTPNSADTTDNLLISNSNSADRILSPIAIDNRSFLSVIYQSLVSAIATVHPSELSSPDGPIIANRTFSSPVSLSQPSTPIYGRHISGSHLVAMIARLLDTSNLRLARDVADSLAMQCYIVLAASGEYVSRLFALDDVLLAIVPCSMENYPVGVLLPLTVCYSYGCSRNYTCYSCSCPRRLEALRRQHSDTLPLFCNELSLPSLNGIGLAASFQPRTTALWRDTVPKKVFDNLPPKEHKRQEIIFELINGERDYIRDLEAFIKIFMVPLSTLDMIPLNNRSNFIQKVFLNVLDLLKINIELLKKLVSCQKDLVVYDGIGDAFLQLMDAFDTYIYYGGNQVYAKAHLEDEKAVNPPLCQFLEECASKPELRKLPFESFLAAPTTRLARYPLLLKEILKYTEGDHTDSFLMTKARDALQAILSRLNREAGHAVNRLRLTSISRSFGQFETMEDTLRLLEDDRILVREGKLTLSRRSSYDCEVTVFLFDHMLVVAREKVPGHLKMVRHALPLELVTISSEQSLPISGNMSSFPDNQLKPKPKGVDHFRALTFVVTFGGHDSGNMTLQAMNYSEAVSWKDAIDKQKSIRRLQTAYISPIPLWRGPIDWAFPDAHPSTAVLWEGAVIVGTSGGVYVLRSDNPSERLSLGLNSDRTSFSGSSHSWGLPVREKTFSTMPISAFRKIIDIKRVTKVDILLESRSILVLADRVLYTFPADIIVRDIPHVSKGRKVSSSVSFFKQGNLMNKPLLCTVDSKPLNSSIKIWQSAKGDFSIPMRDRIGRFFGSGHHSDANRNDRFGGVGNTIESLRLYKVFSFCDWWVGILDDRDKSLEFVLSREYQTPVAIFRLADGCFLLCFQEFSFIIDKFGRRTKSDWMVQWYGVPTDYAVVGDFLLAFDPLFIEVRNIDTGALVQIMTASDICGEAIIANDDESSASPLSGSVGVGGEGAAISGSSGGYAAGKLRPLNVTSGQLYLAAGAYLGQLLSTSIAHLVVECEQVTGHRIQSGLVPAIQKSRLRLLGRALDPGVENVYTWLRGGVLNGEADLDQRWLDGTVEHESMGMRHDNRALGSTG